MRWSIDENKGDILYEVERDNLILKIKPEVIASINTPVAGGGGGDGIYHIKLNDDIRPSDTNAFTALRTLKEIGDAMDDVLVEGNEMFLRKDIDDTAHGNILFDKKIGSSIFIDGWEGKGWEILASGAAVLDSLRVRSDLFIGGRLGSPTFASGFPEGWGWDLSPYTIINSAGMEETRYRLEIDDIVARGSARFYEMIISQLRGENDNVMFSGQMKVAYYDQATGRLYLDTELGILYNPFRHGDLLEVQRYNGMPSADNDYYITKQYELQVDEVGIGSLAHGEDRLDWITFKNFVGDFSLIAKGDVLTRVDSATNSTRKGVVKITTIDELGTPHISALYGMKTNPDDCILARMGNCASIRTKSGKQLDETVGFYARGAHLEYSTIVLNTGETIEQTFTAMGGKFESLIGGIRDDMSSQAGNILVNSSFSQNTNYWTTANTVHFINVNSHYLWMDGSFYVDKEAVTDIYNDAGQNRLRIRNTYILQQNALFRLPERTEVSEEGYTYSFSFKYKVLRAGTLSAGFPGTDLWVEQQLSPSDGYQKLSKVGIWNETGDFELRFTGEILIYGVSLFNDSLADAQIKLQTQIDQTKEYIKLLATKEYVDAETGKVYVHYDSQLQITAEQMSGISTKVDDINNTIESSGWITEAQGTTIFAKKDMENGSSIVNAINVGTGGILIQANRINLVGAVSFSMFDYSLQSSINGKVNSSSLGGLAYQDYIYDSDLSSSLSQTIANKVSSNALKSFAFANGADITKGDLANALQTEINNKLTGTATASGNKLADVIINGQTLIAGGYIQGNLLYVDEVYATKGTIGGFQIGTNSITHAYVNDVYFSRRYDFKLTNEPEKPYLDYTFRMDNGELGVSRFGAYSVNASGDSLNMIYLRNRVIFTKSSPVLRFNAIESSIEGYVNSHIYLTSGATFPTNEEDNSAVYLHCNFSSGGSQRSIKLLARQFSSDVSWFYRTCIKLSQMPTLAQINTVSTSGTKYNVKWDSATGYLYIE